VLPLGAVQLKEAQVRGIEQELSGTFKKLQGGKGPRRAKSAPLQELSGRSEQRGGTGGEKDWEKGGIGGRDVRVKVGIVRMVVPATYIGDLNQGGRLPEFSKEVVSGDCP